MRIIVDAMGGDNAPLAIIKGALRGQKRWGVDITLAGDEAAIRDALSQCGVSELPQGMDIVPTTEEVTMEDDPATVFRRKKDSSMGVGLTLLRDGKGDAFISAGSTGALLTGATLITKRIRGIRRAAMAPVMPTTTGRCVLIDCGANAECTPEYLLQFAYLGSFYAQRLMGVEKPRVGLLNIGSEPSKGDTLRHETYALLEEAGREGRLNFIGNIEANTALLGGADVIVADGYSGNILLKTVEGAAKLLLGEMKKAFLSSTKSKLGALLIKDSLGDVKKLLDPSEVGGTPFLGISKPVLKAHGSSDARAIRNAVFRAVEYAQSGIIADVEAHIDVMKVEKNG